MTQDPFQPEIGASEARQLEETIQLVSETRRRFPRGGFRKLDSLEIEVLLAIAHLGDCLPGEIASALRLEQNTVSDPIRSLTERRLVSVRPDRTDRRRRVVRLRKAGRSLVISFLRERAT